MLRDLLMLPFVLGYPNFDMSFVMYFDVSIKNLGSALKQEEEDGKLHLLAYESRIISKVERNYGITKLEAVVWYGVIDTSGLIRMGTSAEGLHTTHHLN